MDSELPNGLPQSFAIVACQRSGTHLLREILNSNPQVAVVAEALLSDAGAGSWYYFLHSLPADRVPPSNVTDAASLFDQYMQQVRRDYQQNHEWFGGPKLSPTLVGLDVKYNQIKCVNPLFTDLRLRPFLLDHFRDRQFRVVHLVRKNLLHQAISLVMSNLRKVWRNYERTKLQGRYRISIDALIGYMHWVRAERTEFERLSQDLHVQQCAYEDVVDDIRHIDGAGQFSEKSAALSCLADFLQIPNRFHYNQCLPKVLNRPYSEFIENYDDVLNAVQDSEFSEFAGSI